MPNTGTDFSSGAGVGLFGQGEASEAVEAGKAFGQQTDFLHTASMPPLRTMAK